MMRLLVRFLAWMFAVGTVVFLVGVAGVAGPIWHFSRTCPTTRSFRITSRR